MVDSLKKRTVIVQDFTHFLLFDFRGTNRHTEYFRVAWFKPKHLQRSLSQAELVELIKAKLAEQVWLPG